MIDKAVILDALMHRLRNLHMGFTLDVISYKRNRSLRIVKNGPDDFFIIEDGFEKNTFHVSGEELRGLLKKLIKREFPRSRKIPVYTEENLTGQGASPARRKTI